MSNTNTNETMPAANPAGTPPAAEPAVENNHQDYIDAIQELKANSVSIDRYNRVVEENKSLIQTLAQGGTLPNAGLPVERSAEEIKKELWGSEPITSQTKFVELSLELRDAVLRETGEDIYVSTGHYITPNAEAYASAEKSATIYRECLDYANGNDEVFINELSRRMVETPIMANKNKIRR